MRGAWKCSAYRPDDRQVPCFLRSPFDGETDVVDYSRVDVGDLKTYLR